MNIYIGFGANLGDREQTIREAIHALDGNIGKLAACSSFHETRPVGFTSKNLFINAVALYQGASIDPKDLLARVTALEKKLGRTQKSHHHRYKDRTIDIDILLADDIVFDTPTLQLPHPELTARRFVLAPLCEFAPDLRHPVTGQTMRQHLQALNKLAIHELQQPTIRTAQTVNALVHQLSPDSTQTITSSELQKMLVRRCTHIYIGYDETKMPCAMATLCLASSPTGIKAWGEDIVVDATCRGRGYGRTLVEFLKTESVRLGAKSLNLTSRPEREVANRLYTNAGMKRRNTNVYRWEKGNS